MITKENIHGDFSHAEDICKGLIKIMFSKNNFDKIINKGDSIKFEYTPGETKWPTTIKDTSGNYMFDNSGNGFNITNNIDSDKIKTYKYS